MPDARKRLRRAVGKWSGRSVSRHGADFDRRFSVVDAASAHAMLASAAARVAGPTRKALVVGRDVELRDSLVERVRREGLEAVGVDPDRLADVGRHQDVGVVVCADVDPRHVHATAAALRTHGLDEVPFEAAPLALAMADSMRRHDRLAQTTFVSPAMLGSVDPLAIYDASLQRFGQKCELLDFLDVFQALQSVCRRGIPGDVAEFGSYRGHSGWLIARAAEELGSPATVHLFDTFDSFPDEPLGIDAFWSRTHPVPFEQVCQRFEDTQNVELVKGDFTTTFPATGIERLSLLHIDCDSYRGTKYVLEDVFDRVLSPGGIAVVEDYGHEPLAGSRLAFHEYFDDRPEHAWWFSAASGCVLVQKAGDPHAPAPVAG